MFDWLYDILGAMMAFFTSITGHYVLALLLYALVFKILFLFFSIKQQQNQIKMAKLTPKIQVIKAKYRGRTDQASMQKQQEEIMELQQKEGASPLSGCLPLLIQLPIIMLLYSVIQNPISYIAKETDLVKDYNENYTNSEYVIPEEIIANWGDDIYKKNEDGSIYQDAAGNKVLVALDPVAKLYEVYGLDKEATKNEIVLINAIYKQAEISGEDKVSAEVNKYGIDYDTIPEFRLFGVNLADTPSFTEPSILLAIPFLAAAASWFSMWMTRKLNGNTNGAVAGTEDEQTQKSMKMMDLVMPVMTIFIAFNFSGMLGIYWVYQSLLGLLQTLIISKAMPLPKFTEEELREMRRAEKEAEKAARQAAKTARHRSLHYIDEEDYDELPEAPTSTESSKKGGSTGLGGSDIPEIKD